jgi:hypothetical protein
MRPALKIDKNRSLLGTALPYHTIFDISKGVRKIRKEHNHNRRPSELLRRNDYFEGTTNRKLGTFKTIKRVLLSTSRDVPQCVRSGVTIATSRFKHSVIQCQYLRPCSLPFTCRGHMCVYHNTPPVVNTSGSWIARRLEWWEHFLNPWQGVPLLHHRSERNELDAIA